uniref:Ribonuclease G n=1 Tax=Geobacter sp. (strain M21) TaxID=443144 RepID=C6E0U6_GEOSM
MLINALHPEEARVAIVEDGRLVDLDVEIAGNEQIRGNIYKGVVVRVEQGLQAAFVDIGLKKLGFLQMGELHPENWKWRDDIPEDQRHRRPRIQEVLRRGQELIVQVEKGERDNKGSALTTYVSLPGRYMVLMPGSDSAGISRKVEGDGERKKLKEIIAEMTIPEGYGYIIRTEAMGRTRDELQKDLDNLIATYQGIRSKGLAMKGAGMIYQESALIIRTIRDYFSADIDEVLVDSKDVYNDVRDCLKEIDPAFEKLVKMHQEKRPIFSRYQLEEQIDLIYEKKVPLKSGGSIFIEPTEALVSIDVNSGKSTGEKGVEDTAFKTNLEAAEEAARQLRLRDLGGLIVIDFIDMRDRKHNAEVEKTLKTALKADKARVNVSRISEFGLLEMSRQRIRQTLNQASTLECPHCDGRGKVKSVEAMALSFLRKVHAAAAKGTIGEVVGGLPLEVAYYLLNRKRHELSQIESDYDIEVTVKGKPSYLLNQMDLELIKREKPADELLLEKPAHGRSLPKEEAAQEPAAEGRKKKKKGKKPQEPEAAAHAEALPVAVVEEPTGAELVVTVEGEPDEHKKKRRRKRKRGKGGAAEAGAEAATAQSAEADVELSAAEAGTLPEPGPVTEQAAAAEGEQLQHEAGEEVKKKRRRKRRRGKVGHEAQLHEPGAEFPPQLEAFAAAGDIPVREVTPVITASAVSVEPGAAAKKGRKRGKARAEEPAVSAGAAQVEAITVPAEGVESAEPAAKPKRTRGGRKAKEASAEQGAAAVAAAAPGVAPEAPARTEAPAEPAKAKRKPRGAKAAKGAEAAPVPEAGEAKPAPAVKKAPVAVTEGVEAPAKEKSAKGKSAKAPKAPKAKKEQEAATAAPEPSSAPAQDKAPAKARAPRASRKKEAPEGTGQASAAPAAPVEEKPKKPRAPRKKKEEAPAE